jgi:hypothetical protein
MYPVANTHAPPYPVFYVIENLRGPGASPEPCPHPAFPVCVNRNTFYNANVIRWIVINQNRPPAL